MRKSLIFFGLLVAVVLAAQTTHAQQPPSPAQVRFQRISHNEIYALAKVWDVLEDHLGFIWFATEDGLIRYDGYEFEMYKRGTGPGSITDNFVIDLLEDKNHHLWVATLGGGLNMFDRNKNQFYHFVHDPSNPASLPSNRVINIYEDRKGTIWVGTEGGGVVSFDGFKGTPDTTAMRFTFYQRKARPDNRIALSGDFIRSNFVEDRDGNLYIGTYGDGITVINAARDSAHYLRRQRRNENSLASNHIYEMLVDSKNRLWIGTESDGVDLYLIDRKEFVHYRPGRDGKSLANAQVDALAEDQDGNIWMGTDNGLSVLMSSAQERPENNFVTFRHQVLNDGSLLTNSIKKISRDNRGSLWIATYYGGVNRYDPKSFEFTPIRAYPWLSNTLSNNNVTAFAEDRDGNLYLGTDGGGLNFLPNGIKDLTANNYRFIELINPITAEPELKIKSLLLDGDDLWIGTWAGGLLRYNTRTKAIHYYGQRDPMSGLKAYSVLSIATDKEGNIWCATSNQGVARYDKKTNSFVTYKTSNRHQKDLLVDYLNVVMVDSRDRVWVGGEIGGLNLFDRATDSFINVQAGTSIKEDLSVNCITEAKDGSIWIGTLAGFIVYNPESKTAQNYGVQDGLLSDGVQSIVEDSTGNFWIGTTNGLTSFDPKKKSFTNYTYLDGLQGSHFYRNSALKTSDGQLLFGGANGWNGFDPSQVQKENENVPIAFTKFFINGVPANVNDEDSPLRSELNSGESIELDHTQNSFAVMFSLLEYNVTRLSNYQYKLDGLDDAWTSIGKERMAAFTNLEPGTYKLSVKATNKDGYWHEVKTPLTIVIHPAWWQTVAFKIIALVFLGALFYTVMKLRVRQLTLQRNKLERLVQQRTDSLAKVNIILTEKNNEILAQNEELSAQNDQIMTQREELFLAKQELEKINQTLEELVSKRTVHLNEVITKLDNSVKTLDRFVYSASHDLSSPMKTIRGLLHVAAMEEDQSKTLEYFDLIKGCIKRFEEVIISMTNYSRNSYLDVIIEPVSVSAMVDQIFHDMRFWPEAGNIDFRNEIGGSAIYPTDKYRMDTILQNLIGNAVKYADPKKERPFIAVRIHDDSTIWVLEIVDNGIGIREGYLGKIFEMFFKASERSKGSGLGLFIVSEAVTKVNGDIDVESTYGQGTTFKITFRKPESVT